MRVWSSLVVVCEPRRPHQTGPPGLAHDSPRTPNVHICQTPPKFNEKTPREGRKERILRREREKKERNFGRSRGRAVQGKGGPGKGGPKKGGPNQTLKPTPTHEMKQYPRHPDNTQHNTTQHNTPHNKSKSVWPKSVLAKVGLAKVGFGQSRPYH